MEKILTLSIAAYNMEKYIRENLDSIVSVPENNQLEIFVIDDGGKDTTFSIAKEYEDKYPGIVHAVHKENGGYGSVQNYSMNHATGKYFKIIDGDDWVDTNGLTKLMEFLKTTEIDVIATNYKKGPDKEHLDVVKTFYGLKPASIMDPNEIKKPIGMWELTFRTQLLKEVGLVLPEHMLYTDRLYSTIPFSNANSLVWLDIDVYCYRIGRDGQSVSRSSRIKHINEYMSITEMMCNHYACASKKNKKYILKKVSAAYKVTIRAMLLLPATQKTYEKLVDYESKIKKIAPDIYNAAGSIKTRMGLVLSALRISKYKCYWFFAKLPKKVIDF